MFLKYKGDKTDNQSGVDSNRT